MFGKHHRNHKRYGTVTSVLLKLSRRRRFQVWEITLDMALDIEQTTRVCFPAARRMIDRFHVLKLAYKAIQEMRIKIRWETLDEESMQMAHARAYRKTYHAPIFENSDSRKQLLARSIYLLYKKNPYGPNHSVCVPVFSSGNILK